MTIRSTYRFEGSGEDFGPRADGMVTAHTTESPYNKLTVADAITLARWQDRPDILGSYNDLICIDGILSCVPPNHASGGIAPHIVEFQPEAWLYTVLPREAVHNPNYFTRNVSFMGTKAWFDANGWPPAMIDNFVTVLLEEEARIGRRVVLTDHEDFQTNRSDAGPIANALIKKRYAERTAVRKDDTMANLALAGLLAQNAGTATLAAGATGRLNPEFNPQDYNQGAITVLAAATPLAAYGWVKGTSLTLADGTVFDARTDWLACFNRKYGALFYHIRDVSTVWLPKPGGITQAEVDKAVADAQAAARTAGRTEGIQASRAALATLS